VLVRVRAPTNSTSRPQQRETASLDPKSSSSFTDATLFGTSRRGVAWISAIEPGQHSERNIYFHKPKCQRGDYPVNLASEVPRPSEPQRLSSSHRERARSVVLVLVEDPACRHCSCSFQRGRETTTSFQGTGAVTICCTPDVYRPGFQRVCWLFFQTRRHARISRHWIEDITQTRVAPWRNPRLCISYCESQKNDLNLRGEKSERNVDGVPPLDIAVCNQGIAKVVHVPRRSRTATKATLFEERKARHHRLFEAVRSLDDNRIARQVRTLGHP